MKIFLFVSTFILFTLIGVHAQWKQSKTGQTSIIREISVLSNNVIWVMDDLKTSVSYSLDGGISWTTKPLPAGIVSNQTGNLSAVNATTAYVVQCQGNQKGIYKTINGGTTWTLQTTAFNSISTYPDFVYFWNENEGVAVGDSNSSGNFEIYTTNNGGTQWNAVAASSMPAGNSQGTWNGSSYFRVRGNSIYFATSDQRIFKSSDKGLTWVAIKTPCPPSTYTFTFDFKDDNNGLIGFTNLTSNCIYSTTNGGSTWTNTSIPTVGGSIKYFASSNGYISTSPNPGGLSYSTDNGQTWKNHPSFTNVGVGEFGFSQTGRIVVGGVNDIFYSDNFIGENISVKSSKIINSNSIDITYTQNADPVTSIDTSKYNIGTLYKYTVSKIKIKKITQDQYDKSIVHLVMDNNLPLELISVYIHNVYDSNGTNGNSIIYDEPGYLINFINYNFSKTVNVNTPGTLFSLFTTDELAQLQNVTITGTIDAKDFRIIRDSLLVLKTLDISSVNIAAYQGSDGTYSTVSTNYPANATPQYAFYNPNFVAGEIGLSSVILPTSLTELGNSTFANCSGLTSVVMPNSLTTIGSSAFSACTFLNNLIIPPNVTSIGSSAFYDCYGLNSLYSYPATPVDLSASTGVFTLMNIGNCILHVPTGTKTAYQMANQWRNFWNIVELPVSDTKLIQSNNISLYPNPAITAFSVKGTTGKTQLNLFYLTGKQVLSTKITGDNSISVHSLPVGVYVVKIITEDGVIEKKLVKK
jgi:photosystem II stability/assembly factor-like uncharacterized protein